MIPIEALEKIVRDELTRGAIPAEGMKAVIDGCARERPHPDWTRFRKLNSKLDVTHSTRRSPPDHAPSYSTRSNRTKGAFLPFR
jgi:hypothetical protein